MLAKTSSANAASHDPLAAMLLPPNKRAHERHDERAGPRTYRLHDRLMPHATNAVEVYPPDIVKRRTVAWDGMAAEIVQAVRPGKIRFRFRAPLHLLALYDQGIRSDGETFIDGLPRSKLRDVSRKLTLVPAGHVYHDEWQDPRVLARVVYFYFDPAKMPTSHETETGPAPLAARLFFDNATLSDTAHKLKRLIERADASGSPYLEALGTVLAHELRLAAGAPRIEIPVRGGLAAWQQRVITSYIKEHLVEKISLTTLARLVSLSPYHFCRAFRQSFGTPPHRYHSSHRIEHAKTLLAEAACSVTEIGLAVGFRETSSFTAAFRKTTGQTPTAYRRSLASIRQDKPTGG